MAKHNMIYENSTSRSYILFPYIMLCLAQDKNGIKEKNLSGLKLA